MIRMFMRDKDMVDPIPGNARFFELAVDTIASPAVRQKIILSVVNSVTGVIISRYQRRPGTQNNQIFHSLPP